MDGRSLTGPAAPTASTCVGLENTRRVRNLPRESRVEGRISAGSRAAKRMSKPAADRCEWLD